VRAAAARPRLAPGPAPGRDPPTSKTRMGARAFQLLVRQARCRRSAVDDVGGAPDAEGRAARLAL
jgi:hypothetical protein